MSVYENLLKRIHVWCINCRGEFTTNNLEKHFSRCIVRGGKIIKLIQPKNLNCQFCEKLCHSLNSFRQHERCCPKNINRNYRNHRIGKPASTKGKTKLTCESIRRQAETFKRRIKDGTIVPHGKKHTEETKQRMSEIACLRKEKHSKYSKNIEYSPGVILESSYEVAVAEILDELKIHWIKVRYGFVWNDNGRMRKYIPDFYLPEYNLYLDPKNDYLIKKDKIKIESASSLNSIKVIVISKNMINKTHIQSLLK